MEKTVEKELSPQVSAEHWTLESGRQAACEGIRYHSQMPLWHMGCRAQDGRSPWAWLAAAVWLVPALVRRFREGERDFLSCPECDEYVLESDEHGRWSEGAEEECTGCGAVVAAFPARDGDSVYMEARAVGSCAEEKEEGA